MKPVLRGVSGLLFFCLVLLSVYTEWTLLLNNLIQFLNPFFHFQVIFTLATMPIAWLLAVFGGLAYWLSED